MKHEAHHLYDSRGVALTESALLTVWSGLGSWHEDLVLVGGLVPRYLCGDLSPGRSLPRPVTLDADLGIALGASVDQYGSLQHQLQAQGFLPSEDESGAPRFIKTVEGIRIFVDFLAESPPATRGTVIVGDVMANILPGIDRALTTACSMTVEGRDLFGVSQKCTLRVCEAGPFLAMKLRAFGNRQQPKDAFDILYTLLHYDQGTQAAVAAFAEEVRLGNPACAGALSCLNRDFRMEDSSAPVRAAHFVLGPALSGESADLRTRRLQIQQDVVDAGALLSKAISKAS